MIHGRLPDHSIALVLQWTVVERGTAGLADVLGSSVVVPRAPAQFVPRDVVVCGPVLVLRRELTPPGATRPPSHAVIRDSVSPGLVVLIRSDAPYGAAFGSGIALQAAHAGAAALVTDGAWRDITRLRAVGLPVGAHGSDPTRPAGAPLLVSDGEDLFGVRWTPGDWFVRDRDGVIRLTARMARDAAEAVTAEGLEELRLLLGR